MGQHVAAKRYLARWSRRTAPPSRRCRSAAFVVQGGPMSPDEVVAFEARPGWEVASGPAVGRPGQGPRRRDRAVDDYADLLTSLWCQRWTEWCRRWPLPTADARSVA